MSTIGYTVEERPQFYIAELMPLTRLRNSVCSRDVRMCRACECLESCAVGRRYIHEVDAGRIIPLRPKVEWNPHRIKARNLEARVLAIAAGRAAGKSEHTLLGISGYKNIKTMRKAEKSYWERMGHK